ncbi:MAG: GNAT family N-acetyltransferase [Ornithinimicrobium sp.]
MSSRQDTPPISMVHAAQLNASQLHGLLRLRVAVFIVEQDCPYPELDGWDLAPGTEHLWIGDAEADEARATVRILARGEARVIGRVATAESHRGRGYAGALMDRAVGHVGDREVTLEAQARLEPWYAQWGFVRAGADYLEDGIAHVPMRKPGLGSQV